MKLPRISFQSLQWSEDLSPLLYAVNYQAPLAQSSLQLAATKVVFHHRRETWPLLD
jgi:hypothetical protein